jgi:hypothetical protein
MEAPPRKPSRVSRRKQHSAALSEALNLLGHPGFRTLFSGLDDPPAPDPAVVLVAILSCDDLDERIVEAAPWLILRFEHLDWDWILREARDRGIQNRVGFVVNLAAQIAAEGSADRDRLVFLSALEERCFEMRLEKEDTLCQKRMPEAQRQVLRESRASEARQWGLLTNLRARDVDCPGF